MSGRGRGRGSGRGRGRGHDRSHPPLLWNVIFNINTTPNILFFQFFIYKTIIIYIQTI